MPPNSYEETHENILVNAKNAFLVHGFEKANLRDICKAAGVTTGAFYRHFTDKQELFSAIVDPIVDQMMETYDEACKTCFDHLSKSEIKEMYEHSTDTGIEFVEYIYDNFEIFKLLLCCSEGTRYTHFIDWLVQKEAAASEVMFDMFDEIGIKYTKPPAEVLHMIQSGYFNCLFETVQHDYSREDALRYMRIVNTYSTAGKNKIMHLDENLFS